MSGPRSKIQWAEFVASRVHLGELGIREAVARELGRQGAWGVSIDALLRGLR